MSIFGDYASNAITPIAETFFQVYINATLNAGENLYSIGSFTMPFSGQLTCEAYAEVSWPGTAAVATWFSIQASPASSTSDLSVNQCGVGGFATNAEMRAHAWWDNQIATISATARLYCTEAGTVYCRYVGGFWRPNPASVSIINP